MENIFLFAGVISILFILAKFIEMRFVNNEAKPLKTLIRDGLMVFISCVLGYYLLAQFSKDVNVKPTVPDAFTDSPGF